MNRTLSKDNLDLIKSYLKFKDVLSISETSRQMHFVIEKHGFFMKSARFVIKDGTHGIFPISRNYSEVSFSLNSQPLNSSFLENIMCFNAALTSLSFCNVQISRRTTELLVETLECLQSLKNLEFLNVKFDQISSIDRINAPAVKINALQSLSVLRHSAWLLRFIICGQVLNLKIESEDDECYAPQFYVVEFLNKIKEDIDFLHLKGFYILTSNNTLVPKFKWNFLKIEEVCVDHCIDKLKVLLANSANEPKLEFVVGKIRKEDFSLFNVMSLYSKIQSIEFVCHDFSYDQDNFGIVENRNVTNLKLNLKNNNSVNNSHLEKLLNSFTNVRVGTFEIDIPQIVRQSYVTQFTKQMTTLTLEQVSLQFRNLVFPKLHTLVVEQYNNPEKYIYFCKRQQNLQVVRVIDKAVPVNREEFLNFLTANIPNVTFHLE